MTIAAGAIALAAWLYFLLARGGFWLEFSRHFPKPQTPPGSPAVVAVIPARNEAPFVGKAIGSLAEQEYSGRFHIVLVDDGSDDGTGEIARSAAKPELLTVVQAATLPAGWSGKLWAVCEGVRAAGRLSPDYLLLTDADIVHGPGAVRELVARAESGYELVSWMATLQCESLAEQALIPAFVFFFFMLYPPAWVRDPRARTAGAAGGCMLIRRSAMEEIGGIEAIRGALIDDCTLAQAVKEKGRRVWLSVNPETRSIRPYGSFSEIGGMISRTAFTQLRHSGLLLLLTCGGMAVIYLTPPLLCIFGSSTTAALGSAAWLAMCCAYFPAIRFYHRPAFWAPFLPLVALFYLAATIHSAIRYWRGTGGRWKGRIQDSL